MKDQAIQLLATGQTPAQVAAVLGLSAATVRVWKSRAGSPGESKGKAPAAPAMHPKRPAIVAQKPRADLRNIARDALALGIVAGHGALIWYDCWAMWSAPGAIGGGVAFGIVILAILFASDPTRNRTSSTALYFVLLVDCAAWFVHYPTFKMYAAIGNLETGVFAAFLCACSWGALYIYRDSKID